MSFTFFGFIYLPSYMVYDYQAYRQNFHRMHYTNTRKCTHNNNSFCISHLLSLVQITTKRVSVLCKQNIQTNKSAHTVWWYRGVSTGVVLLVGCALLCATSCVVLFARSQDFPQAFSPWLLGLQNITYNNRAIPLGPYHFHKIPNITRHLILHPPPLPPIYFCFFLSFFSLIISCLQIQSTIPVVSKFRIISSIVPIGELHWMPLCVRVDQLSAILILFNITILHMLPYLHLILQYCTCCHTYII